MGNDRQRLLDDTIRRRDRGTTAPWTLGEALAVVGPGWWRLVRVGFVTAAERPGTWVADVRQKCAVLRVSLRHPEPARWPSVAAIAEALADASRRTCEACGSPVPPVRDGAWRNHCAACAACLRALAATHPRDAERRLWMQTSRVWLPEWEW